MFLYGLRQLFYLLSQINYLKSSRISWEKHRHRAGDRAVISELMKCLLLCFSQDDVTEWCIAPKQSYIEDEHRQGTFHHNEFFYFYLRWSHFAGNTFILLVVSLKYLPPPLLPPTYEVKGKNADTCCPINTWFGSMIYQINNVYYIMFRGY